MENFMELGKGPKAALATGECGGGGGGRGVTQCSHPCFYYFFIFFVSFST